MTDTKANCCRKSRVALRRGTSMEDPGAVEGAPARNGGRTYTKQPRFVLCLLLLLLAAGCALWAKLSAMDPDLAQKVPLHEIVKGVAGVLSGLSAWAPFSMAELLLAIAMPAAVLWVLRQLRSLITGSDRGRQVFRMLTAACTAISLLTIWFYVGYGFSYSAPPAARSIGLESQPVLTEDLVQTARQLVRNTNALSNSVDFIGEAGAPIPYTFRQAAQLVGTEYDQAAKLAPVLAGSSPVIKPIHSSYLLNRLGITGFFFPFTGEANVTTQFPHFMIPFTMAHELSHQRGIAREDEANFFAYYVLRGSAEPYLRYSASAAALLYVSNALYSTDQERCREVMSELDVRVQGEYASYSAFLRAFEGPVKEAGDRTNDLYLQVNSQRDGIKSYGRMVDLTVALFLAGGIPEEAPANFAHAAAD